MLDITGRIYRGCGFVWCFEDTEFSGQFTHAANPAIIIVGLGAHVAQNLFMGQDQECLAADGLYASLCHRFRLHHAVYACDVIL